jgi:hypothetical protein
MIYIYLAIVILIIIILFIINYYLNHNIESFRGNSVYSKKYILDNCGYNWSKMNGVPNQLCNSDAWVTDPRYLCSICGDANIPLISVPPPANSTNPTFFGCNNGQPNDLGINWNNSTSQQLTPCDPFISDIFTCNKMNKASTADMYLFIQSNSTPNIINSGNYSGTPVNVGFAGQSYYYCYYYQNVSYNTLFTINSTGFCLSYMWNKQLFILDNNGYQAYANIIKYNLNTQHIWGTASNGYPAQGMLPWMTNWMIIDVNMNNPASSITIDFNIGHTKDVGQINNDLVAWVGATNFGEVLVNGVSFYGTTNYIYSDGNPEPLWQDSVIELYVPNMSNGDTFAVNTVSGDYLPTCLSVTYIWHGIVYSFPSSLPGFNNVVQLITPTSSNFSNYSDVRFYNEYITEAQLEGYRCTPAQVCVPGFIDYSSSVQPINNLLFNTNWMLQDNPIDPWQCCCSGCDGGCCEYTWCCQPFSYINFSSTISDVSSSITGLIFPIPDNNYV